MSDTHIEPTSTDPVEPQVPPTPTEPTEPIEPVQDPTDPTPPIDPVEPPPTDPQDPTPPTPEPTPAAPTVDYKTKFSESTRRNQIVEGQKAELERVLADITTAERPTEEDMKAIDPDWQYRSDYEKNQAIKVEIMERKQRKRDLEDAARAKAERDQQELEAFCFNEPKLKGKEEKFAAFATSKKNRGAPVEVLLNAFLFEEGGVTPPPPSDPTPPAPATPPQLNRSTPSGGNPPTRTGNEPLSAEEIKQIRTTDPKRYMKMVREGKI